MPVFQSVSLFVYIKSAPAEQNLPNKYGFEKYLHTYIYQEIPFIFLIGQKH